LAGAWGEFAVALLVIAIAGSRLARYGDIIGIRTGLGGTWIGLMLIATVTSLPELVTGMSAVALANEPDIAVGTFARVLGGHQRAAAYGVLLLAILGGAVLLARFDIDLAVGHVGLYTPVLLVAYPLLVRSLFRYERVQMAAVHAPPRDEEMGLRDAVIGYWVAATAVVASGVWLPLIGDRLATEMGVNETFVGTLLVALATSLPEVVVTLAALRLGAVNMAMSNIFGSNLFNVLVLAPEDLLFTPGPILASVSPLHGFTTAVAMAMSLVAMLALRHPPRRRFLGSMGWASGVLLSAYLLTAYVLFLNGH
jgi:cation:H+ antiporter